MPVRTRTTRAPARLRRRCRLLPFGHHVGEKPLTAIAVLGQDLVPAVVAVVADRRGGDQQARPIGHPRDEFG